MKKILAGALFVLSLTFTTQASLFAEETDIVTDTEVSLCTTLSYGMALGSRDARTAGQVTDLQVFLQTQGYLESDPTGYFGGMTRTAVQKFQRANGITPNGNVGPATRGKIKALSCSGVQPATTSVNPVANTSSPVVTIEEKKATPSSPLSTAKVTSPNGGEVWEVGKTYTITFETPSSSDATSLYLEKWHLPGSGKEGVNSGMLIGTPTPGSRSFTYTVSDTAGRALGIGETFRIKLCVKSKVAVLPTDNGDEIDAKNCSVGDVSDRHFTIRSTKGVYQGYLNGNLFITSTTISSQEALLNCKLNASNNPTKSVRCLWNDEEMYESTPTVSTPVVSETTSQVSQKIAEVPGPKMNAMSCLQPTLSGLSTGQEACYGIWDYGNEFGGDPDMCPPYGYSSETTGCKVTTKACKSGQAIATRVVKPTSMDINSADIAQFAKNLRSSKEAVKTQIPTLWVYTCSGDSTVPPTTGALGKYEGYLNGSLFISTASISKEEALSNCKTNSTNNSTKSIRCTWNGSEIYSFTPQVAAAISVATKTETGVTLTYTNMPKDSQVVFINKSTGERVNETSAILNTSSGSHTFPFTSSMNGIYYVRAMDYATLRTIAESGSFTVSPSVVASDITITKTAGFVSYTAIPNTPRVKIGSFVISGDGATLTNAEAKLTLSLTGDMKTTSLSNLTLQSNAGSIGTPVGNPLVENKYKGDFSSPSGVLKVVDVYADIGSSTGGVSVTLSIQNKSASSPVVTIEDVKLLPTTLSSISPVGGPVTGGQSVTMAVFVFKASHTGGVIRELAFKTVGVDAVDSLTINGVTAAVAGNMVTVTGLNIPVSPSGTNVTVSAQMGGFAQDGTGSLGASVSPVSISLTKVEATSGSGKVIVESPSSLKSGDFSLSPKVSSIPPQNTSVCRVVDIYAERVPGFVYSNLFMKLKSFPNAAPSTKLAITGAESWDKLTFTPSNTTGSGEVTFKASQTIGAAGVSYILARKNVIRPITNNGEVITCQSMAEAVAQSAIDQNSLSAAPVTGQVLGISTGNTCVNIPYNLHRGNESAATSKLQSFLKDAGFLTTTPTGFYGDQTIEAVKSYQASKGLSSTGMVYDLTRQAIMSDTCIY